MCGSRLGTAVEGCGASAQIYTPGGALLRRFLATIAHPHILTAAASNRRFRHSGRALVLWLAGAAVAACAVLAIIWHAGAGDAYTVAEIRQDLRQNPGQWVNHTVVLSGVLQGCMGMNSVTLADCSPSSWQPVLADAANASSADSLPVTFGGTDPVRALLLRVPLLDRFAPGLQTLAWGSAATYHVRLEKAPASTPCGSSVCYAAELVNAL